MLTLVGGLVRNLVVLIFLNALLEMLLPQSGFRRYIRLVTGLILVLMVVGTAAALLGKLPGPEPLAGVFAPVPAGFADPASEQSARADSMHRQQVLRQCRIGLEELLRREIATLGEWELIEAEITLDREQGGGSFGAPRQIDLRVRAPAASAGGRVKPVAIAPVRTGGSPEKDWEAAGAAGPERVSGLEQALATLLGLAPDRVTVVVVE